MQQPHQLILKYLYSLAVKGKFGIGFSNHLGNVLATVSDRKRAFDDNTNGLIDRYAADVWSYSDYYPFGSLMPGRHATLGGDGYRYGFNGKEGDNEVYGEGNNYDFGARIYDARIGRWLSVDPVYMKFPDSGPYNSMGNNPIIFIDPTGEEIKYSGNPRQKIGLFVVIQVAKMRSFTVRETFKQIKSSDNILTIKSLEKGSSVVESEHLENADRIGIGANATLFLNMSKKNRGRNPDDEFEDAAKMTRITTIGHEGLHAYHHLYGLIKMYDWNGNIVSDEEEEAGLFENLTRSDLRTGLRLTYNQKVGQEYGEAKLLDYLGDFSRSHYDNKKERKALV